MATIDRIHTFCAVVTSLLLVPPCSAFRPVVPCNRRPNDFVLPPTSGAFLPDFVGAHAGRLSCLAAAEGASDDEPFDGVGGHHDTKPEAAQDLRSFLTQRCIQSFVYLLATCTRDLHTVGWLDEFVRPITIDNYWDEGGDEKPGSEDSFHENDKR